jgi:hypothetical protein
VEQMEQHQIGDTFTKALSNLPTQIFIQCIVHNLLHNLLETFVAAFVAACCTGTS